MNHESWVNNIPQPTQVRCFAKRPEFRGQAFSVVVDKWKRFALTFILFSIWFPTINPQPLNLELSALTFELSSYELSSQIPPTHLLTALLRAVGRENHRHKLPGIFKNKTWTSTVPCWSHRLTGWTCGKGKNGWRFQANAVGSRRLSPEWGSERTASGLIRSS